jgi:glycosyltransferase involved in cell wall biosynthesis
MRIAQVAPLCESVPPKLYGGTERVVSYITEELVARGHEVTLFASGDSRTQARLISSCASALRLRDDCRDFLAHHVVQLKRVFERRSEFDFIHFHVDYLHYLFSQCCPVPHVTTLHGRLDLADLAPLYREFEDEPVISISNNQRLPLEWANWQGTVYHGLPESLYKFSLKSEDYLLFLGRISPEKRVDRAIEIARLSGYPLKIAAKVDHADSEYFEQVVRPLLSSPHVEFIGEVGEVEKCALLGGARALLFPIDWEEPFGLVMIEALACGTPVIAWRRGSVPEVIDDEKTGYVCDSIEEAVNAVHRVEFLDRATCRDTFERRFSVRQMVDSYLQIFDRMLQFQEPPVSRNGRSHSGPRPVLHSGGLVEC